MTSGVFCTEHSFMSSYLFSYTLVPTTIVLQLNNEREWGARTGFVYACQHVCVREPSCARSAHEGTLVCVWPPVAQALEGQPLGRPCSVAVRRMNGLWTGVRFGRREFVRKHWHVSRRLPRIRFAWGLSSGTRKPKGGCARGGVIS